MGEQQADDITHSNVYFSIIEVGAHSPSWPDGLIIIIMYKSYCW
jgi:hypothetical protein